jgi:DNA-directed RNA polymerase specialized sigma24 family protein
VTTTEVPWSGTADLQGFVRREEEELLRLAFLVTGDLERSRGLVEDALVDVGRRWSQAREEHPEDEVRRILHRSALRFPPGVPATGQPPRSPTGSFALPEADWSTGPADGAARVHRDEVADALARLTPRQRAVLGLVGREGMTVGEASRMLRVMPHTVRAEARDALERLDDALPDRHLHGARVHGPALIQVLEEATSGLPAPDLGERVAERAGRQRRVIRRRGVLTAGGVIAAGGLGALLVDRLGGGDSAAPPPRDAGLETVSTLGVTIHLAPTPGEERRLPGVPDRADLGVPDPVGPGEPGDVGELPPGGVSDEVVAVYLVQRGRTSRTLVLQVPSAEGGLRLLAAPVDVGGNLSSQTFGPTTISTDRRKVVLLSPGSVVVVLVDRGTVLRVPVPDPTIRAAGWAPDQRTVVALGRDYAWVVDPGTRAVRRAARWVYPGRHDIVEDGGVTRMRWFHENGSYAAQADIAGPLVVPVGLTASAADGWVASHAFLPGPYQDEVGRSQGVVALRAGEVGAPHVLAAAFPSGSTAIRYRVVGWVGEGRLLVESTADGTEGTGPQRRVLLWEVPGARLWHVADVMDAARSGTWFTGLWGV